MEELDRLLESIPGYAALPEAVKQATLQGAKVPDSDGVWPGAEGYVDTYDAYFAAYTLIGYLSAQPEVTQAGSEGTSVSTTPTNWNALRAFYKQMSPILSRGNTMLQAVRIPGGPYLRPVDMQARDEYGDIDTDMG